MTPPTRDDRGVSPRARATRYRLLTVVGLLVMITITATACIPDFGESVGMQRRGVLVDGNGQRLRYLDAGDSTVVYAGAPWSNDGGAEVFWSTESAFLTDMQVCTTWYTTARSSLSGGLGTRPLQPGVALRIAPSPGSAGTDIRAVTVTERSDFVLDPPPSIDLSHFDVDLWDTADAAQPVERVASFDLSDIVGAATFNGTTFDDTIAAPPWYVCAHTLGSELTFKVWTGDEPEPTWDDPTRTFTAILPDGWNYPGYPGTFIGSVHASQSATFGPASTGPTCFDPEMFETPTCQALLPTTTTTVPPGTSEP